MEKQQFFKLENLLISIYSILVLSLILQLIAVIVAVYISIK